jgi:hypothetical protein
VCVWGGGGAAASQIVKVRQHVYAVMWLQYSADTLLLPSPLRSSVCLCVLTNELQQRQLAHSMRSCEVRKRQHREGCQVPEGKDCRSRRPHPHHQSIPSIQSSNTKRTC